MATAKPQPGHGLLYLRDSAGKTEQGPRAYVNWAVQEARKRNVMFEGTADDVDRLVRRGGGHLRDIYLDYGIGGNQMSRPALDELRKRLASDAGITHLFCHHRDRIARPDEAIDGIALERSLRQFVTIVYSNEEVPRLIAGQREDVGSQVTSLLTFDASGRFRDQHAVKMARARLELALEGFSAGGRAPYGFRRALFHGEIFVRYLDDGEIVQKRDHHVRWVPGSDDQIAVTLRILQLLPKIPASRIARLFNEERIPAPGAGLVRKKGAGVQVASGLWNANTVLQIARHPLLRGLMTNGRRSVGDRVRFTADGPRSLVERDRRENNKVRSVKNDPSQIVAVPVKDRFISNADAAQLDAILLKRSETQRGKPRSRNPDRNPAGGRVFDMNCSWPMYGQPQGERYRYVCGQYQQSAGSMCTCNHVDREDVVTFVMSSIRQQVLSTKVREKLCRAIEQRAKLAINTTSTAPTLKRLEQELKLVANDISVVSKNLARARSEVALKAIEAEYESLLAQQSQINAELQKVSVNAREVSTAEQLAADAISNVDRLDELASDPNNLPHVGELFRALDVKLFVRFAKIQQPKRVRSELTGGVLTLGAAKLPIEPYSGRTDRSSVAKSKKKSKMS